MKTGKILISFYLTKNQMRVFRNFFADSGNIPRLSLFYFVSLIHYDYLTSSIIFITQKLDVTAKNWKTDCIFYISIKK